MSASAQPLPPGDPAELGIDVARLRAAVEVAEADEPDLPREMRVWLETTLASEPWPRVMGPVLDRGGPNGVVVVGGREVARWGDPARIEMCFSIAKSAIATVAGTAWADGLLADLDDTVAATVPLRELARTGITWRHLLTQTSDWRGELFGVPWWADPQGRQARDDPPVPPGERFAYNDVRSNLCSLALTHLLSQPLRDVLRARVMEPIGAGAGWSWHGLHGMSTWLADGRKVPVVTGGSHWGGGWWASARDLARYGLLHLRRGTWSCRELVPPTWIDQIRQGCSAKPAYGLMWWLNPNGEQYPGCGAEAFAAHGTGEQLVWCDPERDLVAVVRWARDPTAIVAALTDAVPTARLARAATAVGAGDTSPTPPRIGDRSR